MVVREGTRASLALTAIRCFSLVTVALAPLSLGCICPDEEVHALENGNYTTSSPTPAEFVGRSDGRKVAVVDRASNIVTITFLRDGRQVVERYRLVGSRKEP